MHIFRNFFPQTHEKNFNNFYKTEKMPRPEYVVEYHHLFIDKIQLGIIYH